MQVAAVVTMRDSKIIAAQVWKKIKEISVKTELVQKVSDVHFFSKTICWSSKLGNKILCFEKIFGDRF